MKTIFHALAVCCTVGLLRLIPHAINAEEVLPPAAIKANKPALQAQSGSLRSSNSKVPGGIKTTNTGKPSRLSQQIRLERPVSPSDPTQTNSEAPPIFQVSADPRDQVQFLVNNGVVTVRGSVGTRELARQLIKKYARMPGVRQIRNRLTVRTNNDAKIATQLREALSQNPDTHAGRVAVTVYDGVVFLSGVVSSAQESQRTEELARNFPGVKRVNNGLRLPGQIRSPAPAPSRTTRNYTRRR